MSPLALLLHVAYYLVFAVTLWRWLRHRAELELRVVAVFATTAALFAISFLGQVAPSLGASVRPFASVILLAQPFLVVRLIDFISPLPRWARPVTFGLFVAASAAILVLGNRNVAAILFVVGSFAVVEIGAAIRLVLDGRRRFGLPRIRLGLAGFATGLFAMAIVISGSASAASAGGVQPDSTTTLSRLSALLAAVGYLAAFAPPAWLRRLTQRAVAFDLTRSLVAAPTGSDPRLLWRELADAALAILGARATEIHDPGGVTLLARAGDAPPDEDARPVSRVAVPLRTEGRTAGTLVATVEGRPLFVEDDLALLELLGSLTARAVEREEAIARLGEASRELEATAAVRASEARFRALLDADPNAILAVDTSGLVRWATRVAGDLFAAEPGDLVGRPLDALLVVHDDHAAPVAGASEGGARPVVRTSATGHRCDGTTFPAELALTSVELDGEPFRLAIASDASWRQAADQMRDRFLGVLSHELRTPVTSIYGGSQLMLSRGDRLDEETRRELLVSVASESERLQRMIENLLVLARIERGGDLGGPRPLLLDRTLPDLLERERVLSPEVAIRLDMSRPLPMVAGDEEYLAQVVRNLLSNAAKYGGAGATIDVVARREDQEVVVRVLDDGPGIPESEAEKVFSLYYRAAHTSTAPGAGIGLFVCRELVRAMGGRIWAAARPEGGSEFGFSLPVYVEETDALALVPSPAQAITVRGRA